MTKSQKIESKILLISLLAGIFFALAEFIVAIYTKSHSVLIDAAFDSTDMIIAGFTICLMPLYHKPISEKRPYGFLQLESIFIVIKSFMLIGITISLTVNSIQVAFNGGNITDNVFISKFQFVLCICNLIIFLILRKLNKNIDSPTASLEIYGWKLDVFYSLGMAIAFISSSLLLKTKLEFILPYFDQIIAIIVTIFMIPEAISVLKDSIRSVFLFAPNDEITEKIKSIISTSLDGSDIQIVFFDIVKTGRQTWVSAYFDNKTDILSIVELTKLTNKCNESLKSSFNNIYFELIPEIKTRKN